MNTSPGTLLARACQLIEVRRFDEAAATIRQILQQDPDNSFAHALLSLCLEATQQYQLATEHAERAVATAPEFSFGHYALANVLHGRKRYPEARAAIDAALRLDPDDTRFYVMKAQICFGQRNWSEAQAAAEQGLRLDPVDESCANLRAMALRQQRKGVDAEQTIRETLARDPENSDSHANLGWSLLERRQAKEALHHFQEALRLDPESEFARTGLIHALQSHYVIYRWMFQYFVWISKFSQKHIWAILVGGYFGYRVLVYVNETVPALRFITGPLMVAYLLFACSSWLVGPVTNLALMASPYGRQALRPFERWTTMGVAGCLASGMIVLLSTFLLPFELPTVEILIGLSLMLGVLALPLSGLSNCRPGWPRQTAFAIFGLLGLMVLAQLVNTVVACRTPIPVAKLSAEKLGNLITVTEAQRRLDESAKLTEEQKRAARLELKRELEAVKSRLAEASKRPVDRFASRLFTAYTWLTLISVWTLNWLGMQTVRK
jgi:Tfp pilus assembly protein PilF/xanthosine utilization system XapX-like protein